MIQPRLEVASLLSERSVRFFMLRYPLIGIERAPLLRLDAPDSPLRSVTLSESAAARDLRQLSAADELRTNIGG